jgi:hypothetical protein
MWRELLAENAMNLRTMFAAGAVLAALVGCAQQPHEPAPPANHPANPHAATAPAAPTGELSPTLNPGDTDVTPAQATPPSAAAPQGSTPASPGVPVVYTCPHHPKVMEAEPGECPFCGMKLVPTSSRNTSPLRATPEAPPAEPSAGGEHGAHEGHAK